MFCWNLKVWGYWDTGGAGSNPYNQPTSTHHGWIVFYGSFKGNFNPHKVQQLQHNHSSIVQDIALTPTKFIMSWSQFGWGLLVALDELAPTLVLEQWMKSCSDFAYIDEDIVVT